MSEPVERTTITGRVIRHIPSFDEKRRLTPEQRAEACKRVFQMDFSRIERRIMDEHGDVMRMIRNVHLEREAERLLAEEGGS
jgi:hypothetical protein